MEKAHYLPFGSNPKQAILNIERSKDNIKSITSTHKRKICGNFLNKQQALT